MRLVKYIAFISSLLAFCTSMAQEKMMGFHTSATYHYGYIIAHRNDVQSLVIDYSKILELSFERNHSGEQDWEEKFNYPYSGISLMFFDYGNPKQLGKGYSLFPYYNFPLIRKNRFEFLFKIGMGIGYVEKVFDVEENYKNHAVSTQINGFAHGNFAARYTIKERFTCSAGLSISHFSNASMKKPNLGINIPALNVALGYRFQEKEKVKRSEDYVFAFDKKWTHDFVASIGRKRSYIGSDIYGIFDVAYAASRHVSFKSKFGGGADLFYNTAHQGEEDKNGNEIQSFADILQAGINISYTFQVSKMSLIVNQGVYVYSKYDDDGPIYHRFGIRYRAGEHMLLNLSMKTHWAVADHVELGIGYRL